MRQICNCQNRLAFGVQVAVVMLAHSKALSTPVKPGILGSTSLKNSKRAYETITTSAQESVFATSASMFRLLSPNESAAASVEDGALSGTFTSKPLSQEALRLWMQSYNAGPYALLRYKGNVPYRETRNYTPRIMQYYRQDLSNTPYDHHILNWSRVFGLDPQLIRAIMKTESDFSIRCTSSKGARGLMQVMPCVWSEIKKRYGLPWVYHRDVFEPEKNIAVACAYLAWLRYDFLPKHFSEFDAGEAVPPALIRDAALRTDRRIASVGLTVNSSAAQTTVVQISSSEANHLLASTNAIDADIPRRRKSSRVRYASATLRRVKRATLATRSEKLRDKRISQRAGKGKHRDEDS